MSQSGTYRAIFYGANPLAAGTERDLEYVNGEYAKEVTLEVVEGNETVRRVFKLGHVTKEPISYRYVEDVHDTAGEADVPN